jgi:hypothetical protein
MSTPSPFARTIPAPVVMRPALPVMRYPAIHAARPTTRVIHAMPRPQPRTSRSDSAFVVIYAASFWSVSLFAIALTIAYGPTGALSGAALLWLVAMPAYIQARLRSPR